MNSAYLETRFRSSDPSVDWPLAFVIISAYATTGETWSPKQNMAADKALAAALQARGIWHVRVEGYSPLTGHAEPSWAAKIALGEGRGLGGQFFQDAIFHVQGDELRVCPCDGLQECTVIGSFRQRLEFLPSPE